MKKILELAKTVALVLVVLVVIAMFAGGGSGSDNKSSDGAQKEKTEQTQADESKQKDEQKEEAAEEPEQQEEANDGPAIAKDSKYSVTIDGWHFVDNYDGSPCVAVDYTFTNVSDDSPTSMQLATNITVYQSGVECEDAWLASGNSDGFTNKVKAGVSVNVTRVYKLQNTTDDVEIEVAPLFSWNDELLAYQVYQIA